MNDPNKPIHLPDPFPIPFGDGDNKPVIPRIPKPRTGD